MRLDNIYLAGTGAYLPPKHSVDDAIRNGWYGDEQNSAGGWTSVTIAGDIEPPDMAVAAVNQAFARSGLDRADIDLLVHSGVYPQGPIGWSAPHHVLHKTINTPAVAVSVGQGCNGFAACLDIAVSYLVAKAERKAAIISTADNFGVPVADRWRTAKEVLFADAAAAAVVAKGSGFARIRSIHSMSLPEFEGLHRGTDALFFNMKERSGKVVEEFGAQAARVGVEYGAAGAEVVSRVLGEAEIGVGDLARILHIAVGNTWLLETKLKPMGLDTNIGCAEYTREIGHAGASDIGLQINHLMETKQLRPGDHALIMSSGPGLMISCAVIEIVDQPDLA
jgi:3-oxoacyl-[acyl-carrier-protein] synthase-3